MKKFISFFIIALAMIMSVNNTYAKNQFANNLYNDISSGTSTLYNDGKEAVKTVYSDGKDLIKDAYPEVKAAVISIGQAIGCAAEHVYSVLVKKYVVDGVAELIWFMLAATLFIYGFLNINKTLQTSDILTWKFMFPCIWAIIGFIILCNVDYQQILMGLINPEWGAINYILEYTKTMV